VTATIATNAAERDTCSCGNTATLAHSDRYRIPAPSPTRPSEIGVPTVRNVRAPAPTSASPQTSPSTMRSAGPIQPRVKARFKKNAVPSRTSSAPISCKPRPANTFSIETGRAVATSGAGAGATGAGGTARCDIAAGAAVAAGEAASSSARSVERSRARRRTCASSAA
jgi:hypothetical protein